MNKIRELFKANVVSLKIQKLVIKESVTFSPMPEHAVPCPSMLAYARGVSVNSIIYIEDERETWRTRQIKIYKYIITIYIIYMYNLYVRYFVI